MTDDIVLTDTAKSKCYRLLSSGELKHAVDNEIGNLWIDETDDTNILFHQTNRSDLPGEVAILYKDDGDDKVVVTQTHNHSLRDNKGVKPV